MYQIIAELRTLVYPNSGASYSLIPQDLKQINWKLELNPFYHKILKLTDGFDDDESNNELKNNKIIIKKIFKTFFDEKNSYPKTLVCIIAGSLSEEFTQFINESFMSECVQDQKENGGIFSRYKSSIYDVKLDESSST